jgi:hypothetical protein
MDNGLLTATSIDTKNAQRINKHLTKAVSLKELPYSKEEIQEEISGLVQAAKQETELLLELIDK